MGKKLSKALSGISLSWCILIGIIYTGAASAGGFAVIVNESNTTDNVSFGDLVKYFSAQKRFWPNQKKVVIILPAANSREKEILLKKVYKSSEDSLNKRWLWKVYKGEIASPPKTVNSPASAITAVMQEKGAISVVNAEDVADTVKVLKINGKTYTEPGYPLVK